jgi:CRISPR-associated endonuclease Cas2
MKQFSVYQKPVSTLDVGKNLVKKISRFVPDNSFVSFLYVTDKQYMMAENYLGKQCTENEEEKRENEGQLLLF